MAADLRAGIEALRRPIPNGLSLALDEVLGWNAALDDVLALLAAHPVESQAVALPVADCGHVPTLDPDGRTASCHPCGRMWPLSYLAAHPVQDEADASCNHERAAERLAHTTLLDRDSARVFLDGMAAMSDPAPVQVTTAEELDALPVGSVVLSKVGTIAARRDAEHGVCFGVDAQFPWADTLALPATLLYRPEVTP